MPIRPGADRAAIAVMDVVTAVGRGTILLAVNKDYALTPGTAPLESRNHVSAPILAPQGNFIGAAPPDQEEQLRRGLRMPPSPPLFDLPFSLRLPLTP